MPDFTPARPADAHARHVSAAQRLNCYYDALGNVAKVIDRNGNWEGKRREKDGMLVVGRAG